MVRLLTSIVLVCVSPVVTIAADFNPKDLDNLEMFLESVNGLAVATNTSQDAYESTGENTPLDLLWSDKDRFPHGTVRW